MTDTSDGQQRTRGRPAKEGREEEILEAALEEFSSKGFAAARLDDIASRAGVAKGTIYLYFGSKEELFEGVVRHWIVPKVEYAERLLRSAEGTTEDLLRLLIGTLYREFVNTRLRLILRLMIAEGERFPGLVEFYYENVLKRGMTALRAIVERGVARGELRESNVSEYPQTIAGPAIFAAVWMLLFQPHAPIDLDELREAHVDLVMNGLRKR